MKTLPDIALQGQALSVGACIRYLKCNGWVQIEADRLERVYVIPHSHGTAAAMRYLKCNGWVQPDPETLLGIKYEKEAK